MSTVDRSELPATEHPLSDEACPSVYSLIKRHTLAYMQQHGDSVSPHVESTLLRMSFCRTAALGSRTYRCDSCDYGTTVNNSCGDRHCPNCSGAKRRDWMESSTQLLIDGVTYFQIVFTLPQQLSSLALGNRQLMYDLLFKAAWQALKTKVETERGIQAGSLAVLHTWNQELGHHPHLHMMVPGSGLSLDGKSWVDCRLTREGKPFLVDNTELGHDFRDLYLSYLTQAACTGELKLDDSCYIADLIDDLRMIDWNVFIEGPPQPHCPPEHMIRYLTRYMTGGPISDKRIIGESNGRIWFQIRRRDKQPGQEPFSLPQVEFVRRWALHILPKDYTKVRQFGCWTSTKRTAYLKASRAVLDNRARQEEIGSSEGNVIASIRQSLDTIEQGLELLASETSPASSLQRLDFSASSGTPGCRSKRCPHCQGEMRCVAQQDRPAWRDIFYGPNHPWWFEWTSAGQPVPPLVTENSSQEETSPISWDDESEPDIFQQVIDLNREAAIASGAIGGAMEHCPL